MTSTAIGDSNTCAVGNLRTTIRSGTLSQGGSGFILDYHPIEVVPLGYAAIFVIPNEALNANAQKTRAG